MIKLSKKVTFVLMIITTILLAIFLRKVNWENVNENIYKELSTPFACLILTIYYMIYYVRIIKKENKLK